MALKKILKLFFIIIGSYFHIFFLRINIDDIKNYEIKTEKKVKNFVDVSINSISSTEIIPVVLCDDDKMYILGSPILYSEEYYQLFDDFIVFENDLTVTTMDGVILKDTTENPIKLLTTLNQLFK